MEVVLIPRVVLDVKWDNICEVLYCEVIYKYDGHNDTVPGLIDFFIQLRSSGFQSTL